MFRSSSFYCQINTDIRISPINCPLSDLLFLYILLTLQFLAVRGSYEHSPPTSRAAVYTVVYVLYCMVHIRTLHVCILWSILCTYCLVHVHCMYVCTVVNCVYTLYHACMYPRCLSALQNGPASVHTSSSKGEEFQHRLIVR